MMPEHACPLCGDPKRMRSAKPLYGVPVCKKCYYRVANRRQLAYVIDWIIFQIIAFFMGAALGALLVAVHMAPDTGDLIITLAAWVVFPLIFFCKDGFIGHSPGKFITGVQAVDPKTFEPIGFGRSFKRNLLLIIPVEPLDGAVMLQQGYRPGDKWAKSKVIWKKYANHPVFTGRLSCERCQYDLTGNISGSCPECGTPLPSVVTCVALPPVNAGPVLTRQ
jgi:hypothetical protein